MHGNRGAVENEMNDEARTEAMTPLEQTVEKAAGRIVDLAREVDEGIAASIDELMAAGATNLQVYEILKHGVELTKLQRDLETPI